MQEEQNVEGQVEEVDQTPPVGEVKYGIEELSSEKIKQVQKEIVNILEKNNLYLDIIPTYNIIFKSKINK